MNLIKLLNPISLFGFVYGFTREFRMTYLIFILNSLMISFKTNKKIPLVFCMIFIICFCFYLYPRSDDQVYTLQDVFDNGKTIDKDFDCTMRDCVNPSTSYYKPIETIPIEIIPIEIIPIEIIPIDETIPIKTINALHIGDGKKSYRFYIGENGSILEVQNDVIGDMVHLRGQVDAVGTTAASPNEIINAVYIGNGKNNSHFDIKKSGCHNAPHGQICWDTNTDEIVIGEGK